MGRGQTSKLPALQKVVPKVVVAACCFRVGVVEFSSCFVEGGVVEAGREGEERERVPTLEGR